MSDYPKVEVPESCCESEKNKNLKTIDDALNSGALNENDVFEFDSATVEIIYGAAERMAKEIKTKDGALTFALLEVARLKAELEKRPEVVRCGECTHGGENEMCERTICRREFPSDEEWWLGDLEYCSLGQRAEKARSAK